MRVLLTTRRVNKDLTSRIPFDDVEMPLRQFIDGVNCINL